MKITDVTKLLAAVKAAYPQFIANQDVIEVWTLMLGDLAPEALLEAFVKWTAGNPRPPTLHDLRRLATEPVGMLDADEAWKEVRHAMQSCGRYRDPKWSTPEVEIAVDSMGWINLCNALEADLPTLRAQFRGMYEAAKARALEAVNFGRLAAPEKRVEMEKRTGRAIGAGEALRLIKKGGE